MTENKTTKSESSHAVSLIQESIKNDTVYYSDGTLAEFIEAAKSLGMETDDQENQDGGVDFMAWKYEGSPDVVAKIIISSPE